MHMGAWRGPCTTSKVGAATLHVGGARCVAMPVNWRSTAGCTTGGVQLLSTAPPKRRSTLQVPGAACH